jgi:ATP-dependent exoDNAse (exonuclease V) alpha subunit
VLELIDCLLLEGEDSMNRKDIIVIRQKELKRLQVMHRILEGEITQDEASMVNLFLMHALLKAIRTITRIVLIGDPNQMPPVGDGNILKDIINSEVCAVKKLSA